MSDLLALADDIERAAEGSRELDARIFKVIEMPLPREFMDRGIALSWDDCQQAFVMPLDDMQIRFEHPAFTTSLDAALSLVPDGYHYTIEPDGAWIRCMGKDDVHEFQSVLMRRGGKCTALALCAASLRAIHQGRSK